MSGLIRQCCFVGDAAAGKTTVAAALAAGGEFKEIPPNEQIFSTSLKSDGKVTVVQFTDTTGADEYERSRIQCYPAADLFVLLFSIISPSSYESIRSKWVAEIRRYAPNKPIILLGTKADLRTDPDAIERLASRQLAPTSYEQGFKMAKEIGAIAYIEVASTNPASYVALLELIGATLLPGASKRKMEVQSKRKRAKSAPLQVAIDSTGAIVVDKKKTCTLV